MNLVRGPDVVLNAEKTQPATDSGVYDPPKDGPGVSAPRTPEGLTPVCPEREATILQDIFRRVGPEEASLLLGSPVAVACSEMVADQAH